MPKTWIEVGDDHKRELEEQNRRWREERDRRRRARAQISSLIAVLASGRRSRWLYSQLDMEATGLSSIRSAIGRLRKAGLVDERFHEDLGLKSFALTAKGREQWNEIRKELNR